MQTHRSLFQFPTQYFVFCANTKHARTKIKPDLNLPHWNQANGFFFSSRFPNLTRVIYTASGHHTYRKLEFQIPILGPPTCWWPPSAATIWSPTSVPGESRGALHLSVAAFGGHHMVSYSPFDTLTSVPTTPWPSEYPLIRNCAP